MNVNSNGNFNSKDVLKVKNDIDREVYDELEHGEFDVMTLRKLVKIERQRANMTYAKLEMEKMVAASATKWGHGHDFMPSKQEKFSGDLGQTIPLNG